MGKLDELLKEAKAAARAMSEEVRENPEDYKGLFAAAKVFQAIVAIAVVQGVEPKDFAKALVDEDTAKVYVDLLSEEIGKLTVGEKDEDNTKKKEELLKKLRSNKK